MSQTADRELLFGLLAIQNRFITIDAFVDAINVWISDQSLAIEAVLVERGALDQAACDVLKPMWMHQIACRQNDASLSLAAVGSVELIQELLSKIADTDVQTSLCRIRSVLTARTAPADTSLGTRIPSTGMEFRTRAGIEDGTWIVNDDSHPSNERASGAAPRFRRVKLHAKGGLGEVYIAEDGELNRRVALKEIQEHRADHPDSRSRFMVEAEITGGLEHPGIVPIYSLGQYDDGRPFYAMRFIQGDCLADAIKSFHADPSFKTNPGRRLLALQKLLRRLLDVCNAIAYAHSRGVLHRDLKPGNVMVGKYGETLVVDWGLAKILGASESRIGEESPLKPMSGSALAATIGVIGTPAYMPPEQAEGKHDELGPASDVYGLGATLYHLLTDKSPFAFADINEILAHVIRGEFPTPRSVAPGIPKGLEAICLKAMATRIEDRYPTPLALAADIEHWLADEPVSALPEPFPQRLARWTRRHRSAAAAGLISLGVITSISCIAFVMVNQALSEKTEALTAETAANAKSRAAFTVAKATIDEFLTVMRQDDGLRSLQALRPVRDELIAKALVYTMEVIKIFKDDPLLADAVASAYFDAGFLHNEVGRKDDSLRAYEESLRIRERLWRDAPDDTSREMLARTLNNLGGVQSMVGRIEDAERSYLRAIGLREPHVDQDRSPFEYAEESARTLSALALLQAETGRLADAERNFERACTRFEAFLRRSPDRLSCAAGLALALNNLGNLRRISGHLDSAERDYVRSAEIYESLVKRRPQVIDYANGLARALGNLGVLQNESGRSGLAERSYNRAVDQYESLVQSNPEISEVVNGLALTLTNLGLMQSAGGRYDAAERSYARARELRESLVRRNPESSEFAKGLAMTLTNLGNSQSASGRSEAAERSYSRSLELYETLAKRNPDIPDYPNGLARSLANLGDLQRKTGRTEDALRNCLRAKSIREALLIQHPDLINIRDGLARTCMTLGQVRVARSEPPEAIAAFREAVAHEAAVSAKAPGNSAYRRVLIDCFREWAAAHRRFGRPEEALSVSRECLKVCRGDASELYKTACEFAQCSRLVPSADDAIDTLREAVRAGWSDFQHAASDPDLASLRDRTDFQVLLLDMMDRAFPVDPFPADVSGRR